MQTDSWNGDNATVLRGLNRHDDGSDEIGFTWRRQRPLILYFGKVNSCVTRLKLQNRRKSREKNLFFVPRY
ncbi:MAG: hypothetical protein ACU841_14765 [Gammaproteobacteria bacterium]